mmetsp:Transcript_37430/g.87006  ORF Transcript_37430/g.87006 Transcript_37430/m.87006 type:complete len:88 (+) Transcript_37430:44-307(+)
MWAVAARVPWLPCHGLTTGLRSMSVASKEALRAAVEAHAVVVDLRSQAERDQNPVAQTAVHREWDAAAKALSVEGLPANKDAHIILH